MKGKYKRIERKKVTQLYPFRPFSFFSLESDGFMAQNKYGYQIEFKLLCLQTRKLH